MVEAVDIIRISDDQETSLSVMQFDGEAICGGVEDTKQEGKKIKGETRVSDGQYQLGIRDEGGFNNRYKKKYNDKSSKHYKGDNWHRGMLCIYTERATWKLLCPDGKTFQFVLIHTGNTKEHTAACYLPNYVLDFLNDKGSRSGDAYEHIYPILRDSIEASAHGYIPIRYSSVGK